VNSAIRRSIAKLVGRTGYHVLSEWRLREWDFARHVRELFARQQIDLVLDVGANVGQYRDFLREQVEYDGWIASFEPLENNVAVLNGRATADPKWVIHDYALGGDAGVHAFNRMARTTFSSFLAPDPSAAARVLESNRVVAVEQVRTRTLAEVWPELHRTHGRFRPYLKMDTQGFDLHVLAGAQPILAEVPAGQSEIYFRPVYLNRRARWSRSTRSLVSASMSPASSPCRTIRVCNSAPATARSSTARACDARGVSIGTSLHSPERS
jgi:FkbM family methyltransferase